MQIYRLGKHYLTNNTRHGHEHHRDVSTSDVGGEHGEDIDRYRAGKRRHCHPEDRRVSLEAHKHTAHDT